MHVVVVFYGLTPGVGFGERLCNVFVHGGQHPVPTAITFGFAAVWAGLGLAASSSHRTAWGWGTVLFLLNLAVAFCQSRGASLALLVATALLVPTLWSGGDATSLLVHADGASAVTL